MSQRRSGAEGRRTKRYRSESWVLQNGFCFYCKEFVHFDLATAEHLKKHADGGRATKENIVMSCFKCNNIRS